MSNSSVISFGVEIHLIAFVVLIIETIFLCFQLIYFFYRPADKSRIWFLWLLVFLLYYNIITIFLPSQNFTSIAYQAQIIIAYSAGVPLSMFFAYYLYKIFDLKNLKFLSTRGPFFFILLPFIFFFIPLYLASGNLSLCKNAIDRSFGLYRYLSIYTCKDNILQA